ncbi:LOW QUALITY PROTEIN: hypothetical protein TorRG33x02_320450 [Trema orientale]|uniref:Uncharacterized protein n=1 Tax=Trema orientale TaxID=63057 RepID=A0A2P5BI39_TREOI|nr:LOW QUALITY PROTEIN: hypothetical protein TorRG33x02_320450 [Trema orientale]
MRFMFSNIATTLIAITGGGRRSIRRGPSPILLKTRRRRESGRRSKWSIMSMSMAMESSSGYTLQVRSRRMADIFRKRERRGQVGQKWVKAAAPPLKK